MKEELTREKVRKYAVFAADEDLKRFATALLEEMDKPKVWDGAPDTANIVYVCWSDETGFALGYKRYTRELPKTRARQIAEEITEALTSSPRYKTEVEIIESALNKYAEELEGKE